MKKLSRNERIGAGVIALIAIILIVITYLIAGSRVNGDAAGDVTITIEQKSDTTQSRKESQSKSKEDASNAESDTTKKKKKGKTGKKRGKTGKRGKSGKGGTKSSKTKSVREREANPTPPRDLLRDTIPTNPKIQPK
ncbi:MAG: hypothetical protein ACI304_02665 [Lepagella sp.]